MFFIHILLVTLIAAFVPLQPEEIYAHMNSYYKAQFQMSLRSPRSPSMWLDLLFVCLFVCLFDGV